MPPIPQTRRHARFPTTEWSLVLNVTGQTPHSRAALAKLCETYWYPLYAYLRQRNYPADDAKDFVQSFIVHLLDKQVFERVRVTGRLRSFLLVSLKNFVANERKRLRKWNSAARTDSSCAGADIRYTLEPRDELNPELIYDRRWALALLDRVLGRLRREFDCTGRTGLFNYLKPHLLGEGRKLKHRETARKLGMSEGSVRVMVCRLRRRYRTLLRDEIAQTVGDAREMEDEIRYLMSVLRGAQPPRGAPPCDLTDQGLATIPYRSQPSDNSSR